MIIRTIARNLTKMPPTYVRNLIRSVPLWNDLKLRYQPVLIALDVPGFHLPQYASDRPLAPYPPAGD
jgi:hypothetical protein